MGKGAGGGGSVMASGRGASSRWFFTREQLENTPSRRCGVEADKELSYRQQAANLIQDMGQRLNVYPFLFLAFLRSRPVLLTTRPVAGPGGPRTWRRHLGLHGLRPRREGRQAQARAREAASGSGGEEEERRPGTRAGRLRCVICLGPRVVAAAGAGSAAQARGEC